MSFKLIENSYVKARSTVDRPEVSISMRLRLAAAILPRFTSDFFLILR